MDVGFTKYLDMKRLTKHKRKWKGTSHLFCDYRLKRNNIDGLCFFLCLCKKVGSFAYLGDGNG